VLIGAITPLLIGIIIAYLVNIFMCSLEKRYFPNSNNAIVEKTKRPVCMIGAILIVFGVVTLLIVMIIPELVECIETFANGLPELVKSITKNKFIRQFVEPNTLNNLKNIKWNNYVGKIGTFMFSGLGGAVNTVAEVASSVISIVVTIVLGIIFALYFLAGKEKLINHTKRVMRVLLKEKIYDRVMYFLYVFDDCFHGYIVGKLIDALVLGSMCMAVMVVFRLPYAIMIGTLIGFTALIPVVGAYVGTGIGALMILTKSPMQALIFIIIILFIQLIEGNIIYPKIMGTSLGLPSVWVLAAVSVGGSLFGIVGMLIGVPVFAGLYRLVSEGIVKKEKVKESHKQ
jgi:predicted PurR-regulated permease PerM